jgi:hypothetical protein
LDQRLPPDTIAVPLTAYRDICARRRLDVSLPAFFFARTFAAGRAQKKQAPHQNSKRLIRALVPQAKDEALVANLVESHCNIGI